VLALSVFEIGLIQPIVDRNDGEYRYPCNINVTFDIPTNLEFASIKVSYPSETFWSLNKGMHQYRVKGVLTQLSGGDEELKTSNFIVGVDTPFTDTPASGVAKVRVSINEIVVRVTNSTGLYYFDEVHSSDFTILRIELLDSGGSTLLAVVIKQAYLLFTFRTPEDVYVSNDTPTYTLTLECPNTKNYIGGWGFIIKTVEGIPSDEDHITLQLLDDANNILASDEKPIIEGQMLSVAQNVSSASIRIVLHATVSIKVGGDVLIMGKWV